MSAVAERREPVDYEADFYAWTKEQAGRLRALKAAGRLPNELDIDNIAEEIESLGRSDLRSVESLLLNIVVHLLKCCSAPEKAPNEHWRSEILAFSFKLSQEYAPSMRQHISTEKIWRSARRLARQQLDDHGDTIIPGLSKEFPLAIDELVEDDIDPDFLIARIAAAADRD